MVSAAVRQLVAVCAIIYLAEPLAAQGVQAPPLTVHAIWGSREYASDLVDITWMKDGKAYTAIEEDASGNTDLYRVDAAHQQLLRSGGGIDPIQIRVARGVFLDGRVRFAVLHPGDVHQIARVLARAPDGMDRERRRLNALGGQGLREAEDGANGDEP